MSFVVGVDLGQTFDDTAFAVVDETSDDSLEVRHLERHRNRPYPALVSRLREIVGSLPMREDLPTLAVDATGIGKATIDLFRAGGLHPQVVIPTAADASSTEDGVSRVPKRDLVSTAQVLLQTGRLKIARGLPLAEVLLRELQGFRLAPPVRQGSEFLSRREGAQNDLVFALAIALSSRRREGQGARGNVVGDVRESYRLSRIPGKR